MSCSCALEIRRGRSWRRPFSTRKGRRTSWHTVREAIRRGGYDRRHSSSWKRRTCRRQGCEAKTGRSLRGGMHQRWISFSRFATTRQWRFVRYGLGNRGRRIGAFRIRRRSREAPSRSKEPFARLTLCWSAGSVCLCHCRWRVWIAWRYEERSSGLDGNEQVASARGLVAELQDNFRRGRRSG
jgi:hypothetical protein